MSHYTLSNIDFQASRTELHDLLGLTGAEISFNVLPAGVSVPVVHAHAHTEEISSVLEGAGKLYIDGEELSLKAGDCFRIAPEGERCISAAEDKPIRFLCIQVRAGSLEGFTMTDGIMSEKKPSWL